MDPSIKLLSKELQAFSFPYFCLLENFDILKCKM